MRCMSFALENCERKDGNYSIIELLKYNFYLPFFYFGPIMTFDQFHVQVNPMTRLSQYFPTFFWAMVFHRENPKQNSHKKYI